MVLDRCRSRFVPYLTSFLFSPYFARLFCNLIKSKPECKEQMVSLLFQVSLSGKAAARELKDFRKLHLACESLFPMQRCSLQPPPSGGHVLLSHSYRAWLGVRQPQHCRCDEVPKSKTFGSKPHLIRTTIRFSNS